MPTRREVLATASTLAITQALPAGASDGAGKARISICTFSCHQHWNAVRQKHPGVRFTDALGFYAYARSLGAEGVQTGVGSLDEAQPRTLQARVAETGGCFEGDLRLPQDEGGLADFEREVKVTRAAGATVARAVLMSGRRYEVFKSLDQFREFRAMAPKRLALVEPVLKRHGLKLAVENHKDLTVEELTALMRELSSEWIGVLVDTGNNIALLDEPHAVVEELAPFALSVHLKDMALQPHAEGFLLSEIACGRGYLDLPRIVATLRKANPSIIFNLEMATRDPLKVPCLTPNYWITFPERKASYQAPALDRVKTNPARESPPSVSGKSRETILAEEESNNRQSLAWMRGILG
jgi:sugar phosphate isomerase/epimerase